jgi:hypothetical protein
LFPTGEAVTVPAQIRAGDTVQWRVSATTDVLGDAVDSATWTLTYYLRTNTASEGATVVGTAEGSGWLVTIAAAITVGFDAGQWFWQAVATKGSESLTIGTGQIQVLPALNYTGTPGAFDGRSQIQKDLEAVQAAIRTLIAGGAVQQYSIGNRQLSRYQLSQLIELESKLKAELKREQKAELMANGLGNPHNLFVRF